MKKHISILLLCIFAFATIGSVVKSYMPTIKKTALVINAEDELSFEINDDIFEKNYKKFVALKSFRNIDNTKYTNSINTVLMHVYKENYVSSKHVKLIFSPPELI